MPAVTPLTSNELASSLADLQGWDVRSAKLHKEFVFKDFKEAFAFMAQVAAEAEKADHHPEWLNVYNKVVVELITHDAGPALSVKDVALAQVMDRLAAGVTYL